MDLHRPCRLWSSSVMSEALPTCRSPVEVAWLLLELLFFESIRTALAEKQWRTRTLWIFVSIEQLPLTLTIKITSLSRVSSDHQLCGIPPSTNSSRVWNSSCRTETSTTWSGLIMPAAGETYINSQYLSYHIRRADHLCWGNKTEHVHTKPKNLVCLAGSV